ncbi:MAG: DNA-binding protein WhiA [Pyramidobacter porci]|uniref:DNA-binding protein WhiA n=1 Tax=Pyramidobacter porci TaxID=2605789 RepID=UPI002A7495EF|nr:DNA-binding protein WhiA [Pyramidobacter porci]MDY2647430.1 DNA-binding protein WhiA [Pyramidobacter porci]
MKISTEQWDEWFLAPVTDAVSAESELSGIVACMNKQIVGTEVHISSSRLWVYRRFRRLWPCVRWNGEANLSEILRVQDRKVAIVLPQSLYGTILAKRRRRDFIRWAWARGVFGCAGSVYNPKRGYYCIMRFHDASLARNMSELLKGSEITFSVRDKENVRELTIRDLQQIMRFCYFVSMSALAQNLEKRSIMRGSRDLANKQANCDSANIRRSVATSRQHVAVIDFLRRLDVKLIPEKLIPLARARLENPEATLSDLGDLLRPQVSKSTVKYRLKKLLAIAEEAGFDSSKQP